MMLERSRQHRFRTAMRAKRQTCFPDKTYLTSSNLSCRKSLLSTIEMSRIFDAYSVWGNKMEELLEELMEPMRGMGECSKPLAAHWPNSNRVLEGKWI